VRLKGLWVHPRSGLPYYRPRRGGTTRLVPLPPDLPQDHPDFLAAFAAAAKGAEEPPSFPAGTIGSTWRAALASDTFAGYSRAYREMHTRQAKAIVARAGNVKAAAVQPHHVRADVHGASNPLARLKAWRFWAQYCLSRGWLRDDPADGVRPPRRPATDGHPTWSAAEIAAFREAYPIGTTPRAIMELIFWTGARISDVVGIGPQHVDAEGVLCFRQTKTGAMAYVPWNCALPGYATGMQHDRDLCHAALAHFGSGLTFLQTRGGRPRSSKAAGQDISAACRAIGLLRSAHGLRKARAAALAQAGATPSQIGAWTGHRSLSEIAHYTREMDRRAAVRGTGGEQELETNLPF
jgi:integrase